MLDKVFYKDADILIRTMKKDDVPIIVQEEQLQGWHSTKEKYLTRITHMEAKTSYAIIAEYHGHVAGYINLYFKAGDGPFYCLYPEIVDFGVLEKYRRKGIGAKLMDTCEALAAEVSDTVCLGVGLHYGYGSAQRMYVKRGYIPDGSGVWFENKICTPYESCCNNDDLVLYLYKKLR